MAKLKVAYTFKRQYARDEHGNVLAADGKPLHYIDEATKERKAREGVPPKVTGLQLLRAKEKWHVTPNLIAVGTAEGWLKHEGKTITISHTTGSLKYDVLADPGYYCCHCKAKLPDGSGKAHVDANHFGLKSPDPENPSGYKRTHYFDCVKVK